MISNKINLRYFSKFILILLNLFVLTSCASKVTVQEIDDPLEQLNRSVFKFNQKFDDFILTPVDNVYDKLPENVKTGVSNHVKWASTPITILNSALQLETENFTASSIKFILNSLTLGFYDLDKNSKFKKQDFGSTLAKYNVGKGPYLVIPFLGPRTLRHFSGDIINNSVLNSSKNYDYNSTTLPISIINNRNKFSNILKDIKQSQDPYLKQKILYTLNRNNYISSEESLINETQKEQDEFEKLLD